MSHSYDLQARRACFALVLALASCSRSTVVMTPDNAARAPAGEAKASAEPTHGVDGFTFPDDDGGVLLAQVLPPQAGEPEPLDRPPSPRQTLDSAFALPPLLPLPTHSVAFLRLPADGERSPLRPRLVAEESLVAAYDAAPPPTPPLPDNGRIRVPSPDVHRPIPLPILARPVPDRASLDDPTLDASTAAALAAPIPPRTSKAPFLKQTLPDPYDRRRADAPTQEETKEFPLGTPQTPRR